MRIYQLNILYTSLTGVTDDIEDDPGGGGAMGSNSVPTMTGIGLAWLDTDVCVCVIFFCFISPLGAA